MGEHLRVLCASNLALLSRRVTCVAHQRARDAALKGAEATLVRRCLRQA
jgi:hypothetical protein